MALSRKLLKGMGLTDEQADTIVEAHMETVDALKKERDDYKVDAEKLPDVEKELKALKENGDESWKQKHDTVKTEFDNYKASVEKEKTAAKKKTAVRELLKSAGVSDKRLDAVLRVYNMDDVELDNEGKIKDAESRTTAIKTDWSDFIETTGKKGADTAQPPAGGSGRKTKAEILAIEDRAERRQEIARNLDLFE